MAEGWEKKFVVEEARTIVVVTASNDKQASAVEVELTRRRQAGTYGDNVLFFCVPDPSSARVGSGGATFNALITVEELISSSTRWSMDSCRIFMIHSGGDSQRLPCQSVCGKAWSALPTYNAQSELDAPIDLLLSAMFQMFRSVSSGLIVASSDVLLLIPQDFPGLWPSNGATGLAIPTAKELGPNHGVYHVEAAAVRPMSDVPCVLPVAKFFQKASVLEMAAAGAVRADNTVLIDTGVIYFSTPAVNVLLCLARTYPLDCCTYLGLDMSRKPLRIELYSDIMMAMGNGLGMSRLEYGQVASAEGDAGRLASARESMWNMLRNQPFYAAVVEGGGFSHVGTTSEYLQLLTAPTPMQSLHGLRTRAAWFQEGGRVAHTHGCTDVELTTGAGSESGAAAMPLPASTSMSTFTVLNTLFHSPGLAAGPGSVVEHSELSGDWLVGKDALLSSLRSFPHAIIRDGIAVQELRLGHGKYRTLTLMEVKDPIKDPQAKGSARIAGMPWADLFTTAGVDVADIWPDVSEPSARTIWTAKLWPVFPVAGAIGAVAPLDPVTADRASLWIQWLAPVPADGYHGLPFDRATAVRRAHLASNVLSAWRTAPRVSLRDLLGQADAAAEFTWRRSLRGSIDVRLLVGAASQGADVSISALVKRLGRSAIPVASVMDGIGSALSDVANAQAGRGGEAEQFVMQALRGLDAIAATASPDVAGRALAVQSALLWAMAGWGSHGYRSGPAHNVAWLPCFHLLEVDFSKAALPLVSPGTPASFSSWSVPVLNSHSSGTSRALAVSRLAELRDSWASRPHMVGRAARHYERAAQLLTAQCIATAPIAPCVTHSLPALGAWVLATCPVRIDLAGGWSDTPPITFEAPASKAVRHADGMASSILPSIVQAAQRGGGLVVNAGVTIDGVRPLGARARRVSADAYSLSITIRTRSSKGVETRQQSAAQVLAEAHAAGGNFAAPGEVVSTVVINSLGDLSDYNQPHAEGALVKCALLCMGLVSLPQSEAGASSSPSSAPTSTVLCNGCKGGQQGRKSGTLTFAEQLFTLVGGSLEVETWSLVPQGSGLGTSSILAAATLAALCRAVGRTYDLPSLNHMVLKIEQMLSTGGGWQDQVGGLWPGVKASSCAATLPVVVNVYPLQSGPTSPALSQFLSSHLILMYTGKTRLAKNLLQRVLRQWAMREGAIVDTVEQLRATAVDMAGALLKTDAQAVGANLAQYWHQKKCMAPMAEPADVTHILRVIAEHVHGASLCGAGGGGFLAGVSKLPGKEGLAAVEAALRADPATATLGWTLHTCTLDEQGLLLEVEQV